MFEIVGVVVIAATSAILWFAGGPARADETPESVAYRSLYRPAAVVFIAIGLFAAAALLVRWLG